MEVKKIFTIIGGGSAYTPGLMLALIHHRDKLNLSEVRLMDIHEEHLEITHKLCSRMAQTSSAGFVVNATMDLNEAMHDVDFVLNTSRPGGFECRMKDETLPLEFYIPGQETVGPGGFFFAMRSVPEAHKLADAIEKYAPKAILLNYTNPANIVTQALIDRGFKRVLGLCDQFDGDLSALGTALGFDNPRCFDFETSGLNHATWHSNITFGGRPLPETLPENFPEAANKHGEEYSLRYNESLRLARLHKGFYPNSYIAYYTKPDAFVDHYRKHGTRTEEILKKLPFYYEHFKEEAAKEVPNVVHHRGGEDFGDFAISTLAALQDEHEHKMVYNVLNGKSTSYLDENTVAEIRTLVSRNGIKNMTSPDVPQGRRDLILKLEEYQRLAAEAATTQDVRKVIKALASNPLVNDNHTAESMLSRARDIYKGDFPMFS